MSRASSLTALVGSRICHDIISPLGAIGNGIELMGLSGLPRTPEFELIEESVQSANARIKFFRIAYGSATEEQSLSRAEIAGTLASVARGGRLSYFWNLEGPQSKVNVRIAFLLFQCFETAMPFGGEISVSEGPDGWTVLAEADRFKIDTRLWDCLTEDRVRNPVSASEVQFALLPEVLAEVGRSIAVKISDARIEVRF